MLKINVGYSLIEILVSLLIVSVAAVNISGLQKVVCDQSRDNFSQSALLDFVSEQIESLTQYDNMQDLDNLDGYSSQYVASNTHFEWRWDISTVAGVASDAPIREVAIIVTWLDATGVQQTFKYEQQLSFSLLLKGAGGMDMGAEPSRFVTNLLGSNKVGYFNANIAYADEAYVIYDSHLFQASKDHFSKNMPPPSDVTGNINDGWLQLGRIDNEQLAQLFSD